MAKPKPRGSKRKKISMIVLMILGLCGWFILPTTIIIGLGMVAGYVAYFTDRERGKPTALTVCSFNMAALCPLLYKLWDGSQSTASALHIMSSPFNWILILAGVGVGWFFAQMLPLAVVAVMTTRDKMRLGRIRDRQKQIVAEWGNEVSIAAKE